MALKLVVDKIDEIDESIRSQYLEKDGKFHLDVEGVEDTAPLKRALVAERKARDELDKKIKGWEKLGKTPEEIELLSTAAANAEEERMKRDGDWDKLKSQMNAKHQDDLKERDLKLAAKDQEIGTVRTTLERTLVNAEATAAIAAQKGVPDLLLPHVSHHVKVVEKDGKYSLQVIDNKGDPRVNGKGDPLTISDLVTEMKTSDVFGRAFEGSGASGSGMRPNSGNGRSAAGPQTRKDFKSEKERAAFIDENGLEAYQALPTS